MGETSRLALEERHQRQQSALLHLAQLPANDEMSLSDMFWAIVRVGSDVIECDRLGIWLFDDDLNTLTNQTLYSQSTNRHTDGMLLTREMAPTFFALLETDRVVVSYDAPTSPSTCELYESYLAPNKVESVLAAPIWRRGRLVGLLMAEHIHHARAWLLNEESFVTSLADIINLVMGHHRLRETERALRRSRDRYELAVQGVNDGIWDLHLKSGDLYLSTRAREVLGLGNKTEIAIEDLWENLHPDDRPMIQRSLTDHYVGHSHHFEAECRMKLREDSYRWVLCRGVMQISKSGKPTRMAGSVSDISRRKATEAVLVHEAQHDSLTGLPNRAQFLTHANRVLFRDEVKDDEYTAILFLDVDRFKLINDSYGHHVGDELLKVISVRLAGCIRPTDLAARLSGDEFGIILHPISSVGDAIDIAETIRSCFEEPIEVNRQLLYTSLSIGIALNHRPRQTSGSLMRDADTALYRAKARSRGSYEIFDRRMFREVTAKMKLDTALRTAVKKRHFELMLQPIYDVHNLGLHSFEALIRWRDSNGGFVSPAEFIPLAEETGLIQDIGSWVLDEACSQLAQLRVRDPMTAFTRIAVNVSPIQLLRPNFAELVEETLWRHGLTGSDLCIEVTESVLIDDPKQVMALFEELRDLGVKIHLDDFGTGYSSLSALHNFPMDTIKVDRSFIQRIGEDQGSFEVVNAIIRVARALSLKVIAEGVETHAQLNAIREMGCDYGQGFLLAHPTALEDLKDPSRLKLQA